MVDGVAFPRIEVPHELDNATPTTSRIVVHRASEPAPSAGAGTTESSTRPQDHDLADASSIHSSGRLSLSAPSLESTKSDRSSLSDWMGSLWGKPRHKHQRPPLPPSQDENFDSDPIHPGEPSHDVHPPSPSSFKPGRRKVPRSVFGTLGFSILNPVPATPGNIVDPSPMPPPPPPSRQLLMSMYQNCPQLLVPQSRLLSRLRFSQRQV